MIVVVLLTTLRGIAQLTVTQPRFHYAIENLDTGAVVRRGTATSAGISPFSLILAPDANYREWLYAVDSALIGSVEFRAPSAGVPLQIPPVPLGLPTQPDSDGDGLSGDAEFVIGSNPRDADTDGDGIKDGAAVKLGQDPALASRTGTIIGSALTPGATIDLCAFNDIVVTANSDRGISVFNVFNRMNPLIIAQVQTPGIATAVACSGDFVAVADGPAGFTVVEITDPPNARIAFSGYAGGYAQAVCSSGDLAFVGTREGSLSMFELSTGTLLQTINLGGTIDDLAIEGDTLYAFANGKLQVLPITEDGVRTIGSVNSPAPSGLNTANGRGRMFVGGGIAYLVHTRGYNTVSVTNPSQPALLMAGAALPSQFGWKHVVLNGSGLMLAASSPNQSFDGPHDVNRLTITSPAVFGDIDLPILTPGVARAVTIYNGLGYVADNTAGLQVISYRETDYLGVPPTGILSSTATNGTAVEGTRVFLRASVQDDVQVRNVEFYLDGVKVATDGNFPFEIAWQVPARGTGKKLTFGAIVSDTGGNTTTLAPISLDVVPDVSPPRVRIVSPLANSLVTNVTSVSVRFSKTVQPPLLHSGIRIVNAGPDFRIGTSDDVIVSPTAIRYVDQLNTAVITFSTPLPDGVYQATVGPPLADIAGRPMASIFKWSFWIWPDGFNADSDHDGLTNAEELQRGTNLLLADSDGDGWSDLEEVYDESDPLDVHSQPETVYIAGPFIEVTLPSNNSISSMATWLASPIVEISRPQTNSLGDYVGPGGIGVTLARPTVEVTLPSAGPNSAALTYVAAPNVEALLPLTGQSVNDARLFLATPNLELVLPNPGSLADGERITVATPPVRLEIRRN